MSIFQGLLLNNAGNRQMKEEYTRAWDYLQKTSGLPLNTETIKKAHKMMGKDGDIEGHLYSQAIVFFLQLTPLVGWWMTPYTITTIRPHVIPSWHLQTFL